MVLFFELVELFDCGGIGWIDVIVVFELVDDLK